MDIQFIAVRALERPLFGASPLRLRRFARPMPGASSD